jgi:hypothetical protein
MSQSTNIWEEVQNCMLEAIKSRMNDRIIIEFNILISETLVDSGHCTHAACMNASLFTCYDLHAY